MQKAIRNTSGKSTTLEELDKKDAARLTRSANPIAGHEAIDSNYERNRLAQAKADPISRKASSRDEDRS
jgi:hypothetical protein